MEKAITLYKASAGTGKTYTLAARYIALLLQDVPASSILAVTFTNKATAEMKQRIMEYLYAIGQNLPEANGIRQTIRQFLPASTTEHPYDNAAYISQQARKALHEILIDFDHFTVCTIDSFLQTLFAGLARDLGYTAHFKVELSDKDVIEKAVDELVSHLADSPELESRIRAFILQRMEDEKGWDVRRQLKALARELTRETYLRHGEELTGQSESEDGLPLSEYRNKLQKNSTFTGEAEARHKLARLLKRQEQLFESGRLKYEKDVTTWIASLQHSLDDERKLAASDYFRQPAKRLSGYLNGRPEDWAKKAADASYAESMAALLNQISIQATVCKRLHNSRKLTLAHLNELGLLNDIHRKVEQNLRDSNRFLLAQTPVKLYEVIRNEPSDATFVLEKAGIRYRHIMIDEFQDTSSLQWENFMPLTEEIVASGGTALFVGDVKQSIYRWRGGDWDILGSLNSDKPKRLGRYFHDGQAEAIPLEKNFRSLEHIVRFNLDFFNRASAVLDRELADGLLPDEPDIPEAANQLQKLRRKLQAQGFDSHTIHSLYATEGYPPEHSDINKFCARCNHEGHVSISLYPTRRNERQEADEQILHDMFVTLFHLHEQGLPYHEMAILVRTHRLTAAIADYLASHWNDFVAEGVAKGEPPAIISAEAFLLKSSVSVCMLICALRYLNNPADHIALYYLIRHYHEDVLKQELSDWDEITASLRQDFAKGLQQWLPNDFVNGRESLIHLPLYELVETLIRLLLFVPGNNGRPLHDDAFLFAFLDETLAYVADQPADIGSFLDYWNETLSQKSIPASPDGRGIQVVSIHKSKGLQYATVFLPCCDWDIEKDRPDDLLWCTPSESPYDDIRYIPITPSAAAVQSIYNADYLAEHFRRRIDNLNLLYVAFTRAENNLFVWAKAERPTRGGHGTLPLATIGQLIAHTLDMTAEVCNESVNENGLQPIVYTCGTPYITPPTAQSDKPAESDTVNRFTLPCAEKAATLTPGGGRLTFRQSNQSAEFIHELEEETPDTRRQYIKEGNLLHKLYAEIGCMADSENAIRRFYEMGLISSSDQLKRIRQIVARGWQNERVCSWFDGSWTLFRECSILTRQPQSKQVEVRRPDRVMTRNGQTVVIDFKFGRPYPEHTTQVAAYMQLLNRMGHSHVSGYVWYVYENRILPVSLVNG